MMNIASGFAGSSKQMAKRTTKSLTRNVGNVTRNVGNVTKSVGSATKTVGSATKNVGSATTSAVRTLGSATGDAIRRVSPFMKTKASHDSETQVTPGGFKFRKYISCRKLVD